MFVGTNFYSQTFCYDMPGGKPGEVAYHIPLILLLPGQIAVIFIGMCDTRSQICISVHFIYVYLVIQYIHVLCVYVIYVNAPLYIKCMNQNMDLDPKSYFYYTSHPCKA